MISQAEFLFCEKASIVYGYAFFGASGNIEDTTNFMNAVRRK